MLIEYEDIKNALTNLLEAGYTIPMIEAVLQRKKYDSIKEVAMDLLAEYLKSEESLISEFSGDFKKSAIYLKKQVMEYLKRLDEGEDTFDELVKDMWIADYYKAESEVE